MGDVSFPADTQSKGSQHSIAVSSRLGAFTAAYPLDPSHLLKSIPLSQVHSHICNFRAEPHKHPRNKLVTKLFTESQNQLIDMGIIARNPCLPPSYITANLGFI